MKLEVEDKDIIVVLRRLDADLNVLRQIRGEQWSPDDVKALERVAEIIRAQLPSKKKPKKEMLNGH